jgi:hypothetical protein
LVPPADFAYRITRSFNTSSWVNVRAAEDRANGVTGVVLLAIGFGVQAIAYVLIIGYGSRQTGGAWASMIAAACAVAAFGLGLTVPRVMGTRWWLVRRFLVELARYDMGGTRHESPDLSELMRYGKILGRDSLPDEDPSAYARRVWKLDENGRHKASGRIR